MKNLRTVPVLVTALLLAGCAQQTTTLPDATTLTVTEGAAAPQTARMKPLSSATPEADATATGTDTATVKMSGCADTKVERDLTYTVKGAQAGTATVTFPTTYTLSNGVWTSSGSKVVSVSSSPSSFTIPVTIAVGGVNASGNSTVTVSASSVTNSNQTGAKLGTPGQATIAVNFTDCAPPPPTATVVANRAPELTVPADFSTEADAPLTIINFAAQLSAKDAEEGDLSAAITCAPASGSGFAVGTTTVTCSVSDTGKQLMSDGTPGPDGAPLTTTATFNVTVTDTTPPVLTVPTSPVTVSATSINGVTPDYSQWVTAEDLVDGAVTPDCTPTSLPIGLNLTVTCTAKDAHGNASSATFTVNVTFASGTRSLLQPVNDTRNGQPISAFKTGSTIPLKFTPPTYADGTYATNLASGLKLTVTAVPSDGTSAQDEVIDLSSGSTVWRYDATSNQYVFNLSSKNSFFKAGTTYLVSISYQGVSVADGQFKLR